MKGSRKNLRHKGTREKHIYRTPLIFTGELLMLVFLLIAASYTPQLIFQVQDSFLWNKTIIDKRENMDVESISVTYEKSLARRMEVFAKGVMAKENYYATFQPLSENQDIYEYLNSDLGMFQDLILVYGEMQWIPYSFLAMEFSVNQWKQYIIYSDNYAEGVNFILWYIELQDMEGRIMKLLMDAETGTVYAFKTENNQHNEKEEIREYFDEQTMFMYWEFLASYYEASSLEKIEELAADYMNDYEAKIKMQSEAHSMVNGNVYVYDWDIEKMRQEIDIMFQDNAGFWQKRNEMRFILPYGETSLDVCIILDKDSVFDDTMGINYYFAFPNVTVGVRQIYEIIPEFA